MANVNEQTTLAGGCFWCIEAAFNSLQGIIKAESGYMGGENAAPTYEQVCSGESGHAEVVQLTYDSSLITFRDILEIFFALHDPTQLNRQGNDVGTQYRSAVFYHNQQQKLIAEEIITEIENEQIWPGNVVTEVSKQQEFFCGEDYHQAYFSNNPENQYCQAVVSPKLAKFRKKFAEKLK